MVEFEDVSVASYPEFRDWAIRTYADQQVRAGVGTLEEILPAATADIGHLLPKGPETPDNWLFWLRHRNDRVGMLWFAVRRERGTARGFVYAIEILPPFLRRGHGEAAMRRVEELAKEKGVGAIWLNVFAYNAGAIHLYEKLGYAPIAQSMAKRLGGSAAPGAAPR